MWSRSETWPDDELPFFPIIYQREEKINNSRELWWRFFAVYDQTVDYTPQVRKIIGRVKIRI